MEKDSLSDISLREHCESDVESAYPRNVRFNLMVDKIGETNGVFNRRLRSLLVAPNPKRRPSKAATIDRSAPCVSGAGEGLALRSRSESTSSAGESSVEDDSSED